MPLTLSARASSEVNRPFHSFLETSAVMASTCLIPKTRVSPSLIFCKFLGNSSPGTSPGQGSRYWIQNHSASPEPRAAPCLWLNVQMMRFLSDPCVGEIPVVLSSKTEFG